MGWILRKSSDRTNPTLPGGIWGHYITSGRGVYWNFDGARVRFILFISDGGKYGMNVPITVEYKSVPLPTNEYKFHPGIYPKQHVLYEIIETGGTVNEATDTITYAGLPFVDGDPVTFSGGFIPPGMTDAKRWVFNKVGDAYQFSSTPPPTNTLVDINGGIPAFTSFFMRKAISGFDDPDQGLPTFCPEVNTTFSGICYIEGYLPLPYTENSEPDWSDFRVVGVGRKLMDYDNVGAEVGVTTNEILCCNPALIDADCLLNEGKVSPGRIDWSSWFDLRNASNTLVWQRATQGQIGSGLFGKYYTFTVAAPPTIGDGILRMVRRDDTVNFNWGDNSPGGGLPPDNWIAVIEGFIKPRYSENYEFTISHDDGVKLYINGNLVLDQWTTVGTHTSSSVALTQNTLVPIKIEFFAALHPSSLILQWTSSSQALEVVPRDVLFEPDFQVQRYEFNGAYPRPTEVTLVHEEILFRCPGWDWTDKDGKITYLPPDRPVIFTFDFDKLDDDVKSTILDKTFEKSRRHRRTRRNFILYSFRNRLVTGFPEQFVEQNRPRLRELGGGTPTNDAPEELMVMTQSLAERVSHDDMLFTVDPPYDLTMEGSRAAGKVTKNTLVNVKNIVIDGKKVEDSTCIAVTVDRKGNKVTANLLPVMENPFYTDEPV